MMYTSIRDFICVVILLLPTLLNNFTVHGRGIVSGGLDINDETTSGDLTINSGDAISRELQATGVGSFVGGPGSDQWPNKATIGYAFVGAGANNIASGYASSIVGGVNNIAGGQLSFIGAGYYNEAAGENSFIGSGYNNVASGKYASIVAGDDNLAAGNFSSIVSGVDNYAPGLSSFIGAGQNNKAYGEVSVISGGKLNTASGYASVVIDGSKNQATGDYSIAMGRNANAKKDQSMVINLGTGKATSAKKGEFLVKSKVITFQIGTKKAIINNKNIETFTELLENPINNGRRHLQYQKQIDEQQERIVKQEAINEQQQAHIEKLQEQINELYRMMTAQSTEN